MEIPQFETSKKETEMSFQNLSAVLFFVLFYVHGGIARAVFPSGVGMYELSTRPWLYSLSQKYSQPITTLSQIPDDELQAIAFKNVTYVWFMGIWELVR